MTNNRRDAGVDFPKDIANHQMTIKLDNGLYRHLCFRKTDTNHQWFELVTFPNVLVINGDMGTWTLSRVEDMFTFFRGGRINPSYWSEKVLSSSRFGGPEKEFDREIWQKAVLDQLADYIEDPTERAEVEVAMREEVFSGEFGEESSVRALCDFKHGSYQFSDWYEINGKDWSYHFIWCLYAIVWGIQQYDAAKKVEVAA